MASRNEKYTYIYSPHFLHTLDTDRYIINRSLFGAWSSSRAERGHYSDARMTVPVRGPKDHLIRFQRARNLHYWLAIITRLLCRLSKQKKEYSLIWAAMDVRMCANQSEQRRIYNAIQVNAVGVYNAKSIHPRTPFHVPRYRRSQPTRNAFSAQCKLFPNFYL